MRVDDPMAVIILQWMLNLAKFHPIQFATLFAIMSLAGVIGVCSLLLEILISCTGITPSSFAKDLSAAGKVFLVVIIILHLVSRNHFTVAPLPPAPTPALSSRKK